MTDSSNGILETKPERLARLMELVMEKRPARSEQDLAAVLRDLLDAPLREVVGAPRSEKEPGLLCSTGKGEPQMVREFLSQPAPAIAGIEAVKEFARQMREASDGPDLREAATVLYYAAIAVALAHGGTQITRLSDAKLREGFAWVLARPWADEASKQFVREASRWLKPENQS